MAYTKDGDFISGAELEKTRVRRMLVQIQFAGFSVAIVRKELKRIYREFTQGAFKDLCINFYGIVHEKELDHCNNNHIHLLIELNRSVRLLTMFNNFRDAFGYNSGAISIDKCVLIYGSLRYFLHLEGKVENKHQYNISDIVTNVSTLLLNTYIDSEDDELTAQRLMFVCYQCHFDIPSIIEKLGLDTYKRYRYVIKDFVDSEYSITHRIESEHLSDAELPF